MRKIKGFEKYQISRGGAIIGKFGRPMKPALTTRGYFQIQFSKNKKVHRRSVHRVVLENFVGPCPEGKECNHINGIKTDNRVENLEWLTKSENQKHSYAIGLICRGGEKGTCAKLTPKDVDEIRFLLKTTKLTNIQISERFPVLPPAISAIKNGTAWVV